MGCLDGKRAIVTGGGTGIGRGVALHLAAEGARVCLSYNTSREGADETVRQIEAKGGQALAFAANLEHPAEGVAMIARAAEAMGGVDILVNNAGLTINRRLFEVTEADWDRVLTIDLKSGFFCAQAAARHMQAQGGGRLIFIGSVHAHASVPLFAPYAASKGGVEALVRQMAIELAPLRITVNCVAPGLIEVESYYRDFPWYKREDFDRQVPIGRVGLPTDIAPAVAFLASDQAGFITGQTLSVDGGQLALLAINRPDL